MKAIFIPLLSSIFIHGSSALIADVPGIVGPITPFDPSVSVDAKQFMKARPGDFEHPGMWHTHSDLERIRDNALSGKEPWASAYDLFKADKHSQSSYVMQGPKAYLSRGRVSNYTTFANDARAAWQNALMWYITKDQSHWDRSTTILDAWGSNLTDIIGTDRSLMIGLDGDIFANAAEIMRWEGNWTETGARWQGGSGFSVQLYWLFSRQSVVVGQANYGMASIKAMLNFAVYLDDVALYNYAINELINNPCTSVFAQYHPETGQSGESGRDQAHVQSGIAWTAMAMRTAQSQGSDLYGLGDDLLLRAAEYTAKFNLNGTVPYDPKWFRCEAVLVNGPWKTISYDKFGITNQLPVWNIIYYQYAKRRGLNTPWTKKAKVAAGFEGAVTSNLNDHPSWGDLIWSY
ncbi:chondroitin AC/alginate lyase [Corynespora cassiicola Philippines]|uniref:Chondroitin AC/alginate lyase n=1 Tax=Corynespora cassiicola Philippines TaxID=1448308 RepID=A0A2T2NQQ5_CORCC|nr:chondroitin AC/alginate lyase [Corynespora cassiicola Philippines]